MVTLIDLSVWFSVIYVPLSGILFMMIDNDIEEMRKEIRDLKLKLNQLENKDKSFK
jgi:hypothetical protein